MPGRRKTREENQGIYGFWIVAEGGTLKARADQRGTCLPGRRQLPGDLGRHGWQKQEPPGYHPRRIGAIRPGTGDRGLIQPYTATR